jgi:hypothetical protein
MVNVVPMAATQRLRKAIANEELMPGNASLPFSKQIDDAVKRTKNVYLRAKIISEAIGRLQKIKGKNILHRGNRNTKQYIDNAIRRFHIQQETVNESWKKVIQLWTETMNN